MKKSRFFAQVVSGLLMAVAVFSLTGCGNIIYREPEYQYAGRAVPPSGLLQRVLATYTTNGSSGGAEILDGLRDTRSNVQDTIPAFFIKGYSSAIPSTIINFPEQETGYILGQTDGVLTTIDYAKETSTGTAATFTAYSPSVAAAPDGTRFSGVVLTSGVVEVAGIDGIYSLNLPNAYKVVINQGDSVMLAMVRNSNVLYRIIKLPTVTSNTPIYPPGYVDCEPLQTPRYCVVPVGSTTETATSFDHPYDAYFSQDGSTVYILNCGPECGGTKAGVTVLNAGPLQVDQIPSTTSPVTVTPLTSIGVPNPIPVAGGATVAISDGAKLYVAGQSLQSFTPSGSSTATTLFGGNLSTINLATYKLTSSIPISDGTHTQLLFADTSTLWAGSSQCANGIRQATAVKELAITGVTDQSGDYNCLTRVDVSGASTGATPTAAIVPNVVQVNTAIAPNATAITVANPNDNLDSFYYGNLTGICWIQNYNKVYTAYGGQIHAFNTPLDTNTGYVDEISNFYITIQGTVLDVAYMDAITNNAN